MAKVCCGAVVKGREKLEPVFAGLAECVTVVRWRRRTALQGQPDVLMVSTNQLVAWTNYVDLPLPQNKLSSM